LAVVQDDVSERTLCNNEYPGNGTSDARRATSAGSVFQFLADGSRVFRVRIDVHEYSPDELSVRIDAGQLVVSAVSSAAGQFGQGRQGRREMNRVIDLPSEVKVDQLVSRLTNDGVLTIEAPADAPPTYQAVTGSRDTSSPRHVTQSIAPPRSSDVMIQPATQVINTGKVDLIIMLTWVYRG